MAPPSSHLSFLHLPMSEDQRAALKMDRMAQTIRRQGPFDLQRSRSERGKKMGKAGERDVSQRSVPPRGRREQSPSHPLRVIF